MLLPTNLRHVLFTLAPFLDSTPGLSEHGTFLMRGACYSKFASGASLQRHWGGLIFGSLRGNMLF